MSQREELLKREKLKLTWLREKVLDQERLVSTLEGIPNDPLDEMFERETRGARNTPAPPQLETRPQADVWPSGSDFVWGRYPRRVPPNWVKLLTFIGKDGKSLGQVEAFIKEQALPISNGAARTGLMNYRKEHGFVESPKKGFYIATNKALEAIAFQEGESPATENSEASNSQPTPLTRAAA